MAEGVHYLRRRRERGQRRVLAVTLTCGIGATALTAALGALLANEHAAPMTSLTAELTQHGEPEDGDAAAGAQPALDARPKAPRAHGHSHGKMAPEEGSPAAAEGD